MSSLKNQDETDFEPTRLRQRLALLVIFVAFVGIGSALLFLWHMRESAFEEAETRAGDAARLLEEHFVRTLRTTDFIVSRVAALGRSRPMADLAVDGRAWGELMALNQGMPEPGTLWVIDTEGNVRLGTVKFPSPPTNVGDRLYFALHRDARRDVVIGPLVQVKQRESQAFHLSRRIEEPDGRFIGVAAAGLDADTFTDFYRTLPLGPKGVVNVVDLDGRVIMRQPDPALWAGKDISSARILKDFHNGLSVGTTVQISPLDHVERLYAFRLVPEFGLVVMAGIATQDIFNNWWQSVWLAMILMGIMAAVLGGLVMITFSSLSREEGMRRGLERAVRERTEEACAQAEEARRANESKTQFLAAASHDLRQPLQAAGMFVEALSARIGDGPVGPIVDKLRQSIDATQALLTTLLDVSTLEAGKIEPQISEFALMPILANLGDQMEQEARAKGLTLTVVGTSAQVASDSVLLERILRNLLVNAVRYTDTGGILLGCRRRGSDVAICVVDTGRGIPEDKQRAIFDDFTRLGDKGRGSVRGLGLGLGVVRRMAQLLRHPIAVRSIPSRGSCFEIVVPRAR